MLTYISDMKSLPFFEITQVYQQSIDHSVKGSFGNQSEALWQEEQQMYQDLQDFFEHRGGSLAMWRTEQGIQSVLRMERYDDGYLLQSLETRPESRRRGYALQLVRAVLDNYPKGSIIYSHINKKNVASMQLHLRCGFQTCWDMAKLLDGTVSDRYITLKYVIE